MSGQLPQADVLTPERRRSLLAQLEARQRPTGAAPPSRARRTPGGMDFSLIFFSGNGSTDNTEKYDLLLESARFADRHGFAAVTTPERHFQPVGGLFPNPAVLGAALAMITEQLQIRAGSVVFSLHNPMRIVEEWSVVDNLSKGRVAVACATGWHPADFIIDPQAYEGRRARAFEHLDVVRRAWRGEPIRRVDITGNHVDVVSLPRPLQKDLPVFLTSSGNPATWAMAGELGANVLCSMTNHTFDELARNSAAYRAARAQHGFDPEAGTVAVMLHTYVGASDDAVKARVKPPLRDFLNEYISQSETLNPLKSELGALGAAIDNNREALLTYAFEKHFTMTSLMGSKAKCARMVHKLRAAGATEIACLIDFGLPKEDVLAGLVPLAELKDELDTQLLAEPAAATPAH
jgi:natural product biosynthesis luciferase-like monooxygenase protein